MNALAHWLIGLGLWLSDRPRGPMPRRFRGVGGWAVQALNGVVLAAQRDAQAREMAQRHAKPSTRRRIHLIGDPSAN